jgi:hypothetical protein
MKQFFFNRWINGGGQTNVNQTIEIFQKAPKSFLGNGQKISIFQSKDQEFSIAHYGDQKLMTEVFWSLV